MSQKKKRPTTLIFTIVVVALAGLTFFDYKRSKQKEGLQEGEQKVLDFPAEELSHFLLKSKTQTIELKRDGKMWKMLQPLLDDVDENSVSMLISALQTAAVKDLGEEVHKGQIDWKKYGLDPGVSIEAEAEKGARTSLAISDTNAFDGSFYVRKNDQLYLGDRAWSHIAGQQVNPLRSHQIWRTPGDIVRLQAHYDYQGTVEDAIFTKTGETWKMEPAFDLPLNASKVRNWVQSMRDLRLIDFAAAKPSEKDQDVYLLKKPSWRGEFTVKKDEKEAKVHWVVGQDRDNDLFLHSDVKDEVYKTGKFSLRDIRIPFEQLLDTSKVVQFPIEEAKEIDLLIDGHRVRFVKGDKDWGMEPAVPNINPSAVADFLQKLRALDLIAGLPSGVSTNPSKDRLMIKSKEGTLFEMEWSAEKDRIRWLKIPPFKEKFKVSAEPFNAMLKTEFLSKSKEEPKSKK